MDNSQDPKRIDAAHPQGLASVSVAGQPEFAAKIIQDVGEVPLVLYSDVRTPLASLSFLRRSLAMAELALISYNDEAEAKRAAALGEFVVAMTA